MKTERRLLGDYGEKAASRYLRKQHFRILERNFVCGHQEVDLIVENREFLVFVEVKTRTYDEKNIARFGGASAAVDRRKQANLVRAARNYLPSYKKQRRIRFDVIEVYVSKETPTRVLEIHHMPDAFRP